MSEIAIPTIYFEKPGKSNTERVLQIVQERAPDLDVDTVLVATTQGDTGALAAKTLKGFSVIAITHATGFTKPNEQSLRDENRAIIESEGGKILTCQHAFSGLGRAIRKKWGTYETDDIVASTLRTFGEGTKVCAEMALMAADAGWIPVGKPCIAVAGTGRGADTAILLSPVNVIDFFSLKIMAILAKPQLQMFKE